MPNSQNNLCRFHNIFEKCELLETTSGILLVNKPRGAASFSLITKLRRKLGVRKIGHAGTLDPFATGVMILLVGRQYTKMSHHFLNDDKEYVAKIRLGIETDTYDCDGKKINQSERISTKSEIESTLSYFQGEVRQTPPMFSAKKRNGKKLYELARKGKTVYREPIKVKLHTSLIEYEYPFLTLQIRCSKGTYIRTIAQDIGNQLGCYGHLCELTRTRCGPFHLEGCIDGNLLSDSETDLLPFLRKS